MTSGTPSSGTDLMSRIDSPRRIPAVPSAPDFRSTGVSGLGMTGSRPPKSSGEATGPRCATEGDGDGPAGAMRIRSAPAAASRLATSCVPGWSASACNSSNSWVGGGFAGRAISPMPWRSRRSTRVARPAASHGTPFNSIPLPPGASRSVTAASWSRPSRARNSFFCSVLALGSRNRLTHCAKRAARLSRVGMGAGQSRGPAYPGQRAPGQ